jgi:hypothetical protein
MSSLGIRNVLPLRATNGLVINNGVIGLNPSGRGDLGSLTLNMNNSSSDGNILSINCSAGNNEFAIYVFESDSLTSIYYIDTHGNIAMGTPAGGAFEATLNADYLTSEKIITAIAGQVNNSAIVIQGGIGNADINYQNNSVGVSLGNKIAGAVVVDAANYILIKIDGVPYKLIKAV